VMTQIATDRQMNGQPPQQSTLFKE